MQMGVNDLPRVVVRSRALAAAVLELASSGSQVRRHHAVAVAASQK